MPLRAVTLISGTQFSEMGNSGFTCNSGGPGEFGLLQVETNGGKCCDSMTNVPLLGSYRDLFFYVSPITLQPFIFSALFLFLFQVTCQRRKFVARDVATLLA